MGVPPTRKVFDNATNAHNVRSGSVDPPEESLSQALELLLELDRTVRDARLGYIRHRTATGGAVKLLPAIMLRVRSALSEITGGEE